jgi:tRNA(Leu) C34 or U34 (ribose-2'-O)-methylase TrmL
MSDWTFSAKDCLVFGRETRGLPAQLLRDNWEQVPHHTDVESERPQS